MGAIGSQFTTLHLRAVGLNRVCVRERETERETEREREREREEKGGFHSVGFPPLVPQTISVRSDLPGYATQCIRQ